MRTLCIAICACLSGSLACLAPPPADAGGPADAGPHDTAGADTGLWDRHLVDSPRVDAGDDPTPVLDRAPRLGYTCTPLHDTAQIGEPAMDGKALVRAFGAYYLLRSEGDYGMVSLNLSSVALDGTLGPSLSLAEGEQLYVWRPALISTSTGLAAAWSELDLEGEGRLHFATFDASGHVAQAPREVEAALDAEALQPRLVETAGGYGLLWYARTPSSKQLRFVLLDSAGAPRGPAVTVVEGDHAYDTPRLTATASGYLAIWSAASSTWEWQLFAALLDTSGAVTGEVVRLSRSGRSATWPSVLPRGDHFLVAWSERHTDYDRREGFSEVRIAHLEQSGALAAPPAPLTEAQLHRENVFPHLLDVGDDVALIWSSGSVIYECGGCVPDNLLRFVLLDPEALVPRSAVVQLESPTGLPGLMEPTLARDGLDFLTLFDITHHTYAVPGSAAIRCEAR